MDNKMKIYKEIAFYTSTKDFYDKVITIGNDAADIFSSGDKNQMSNLLSIAATTLRVTDILNYIKNQAAKDTSKKWNKNDFAAKLIRFLYENEESLLNQYKKQITGELKLDDPIREQQIHLKLCQAFIKQMVVQYNFKRANDDIKKGKNREQDEIKPGTAAKH